MAFTVVCLSNEFITFFKHGFHCGFFVNELITFLSMAFTEVFSSNEFITFFKHGFHKGFCIIVNDFLQVYYFYIINYRSQKNMETCQKMEQSTK